MKGKKVCELCSEEASLYCDSDSAFLCRSCDAQVHSANFLVASHVRQPLCSNCKAFAGNCISGSDLRYLPSQLCRSCLPLNISGEDQDEEGSSLSSDSSVCVSSSKTKKLRFEHRMRTKVTERIGSSSSITDLSGEELSGPARFVGEVSSEKTKTKKSRDRVRPPQGLTSVDAKVEGIFGNWCREMGLNGNFAVVELASQALGFCMGNSRVLPFKVSLAASFWYGLRSCRDKSSARTIHGLRRLEEISGLPAKLIVAVELRLACELRARKSWRRHDDLEEGWAECSG